MLVVNGIDATTGDYLVAPLDDAELAHAVQATPADRELAAALAARHRRATEQVLAPKHGVDQLDLAQAGWAVVFAAGADPAVRAALTPLLEHRRRQAAALSESRFRDLHGEAGLQRGESKREFLRRHGAGPGPVDPDVLSYYLLLVGGPAEIPFELQYQLGVQHAVGRLAFDDVDSYARYARNVVSVEAAAPRPQPARLFVFAPSNAGDRATALSAEQLAAPLAAELGTDEAHWQVSARLGIAATKEQLVAELAGPDVPDVLFTASHGVGFPCGHPRQPSSQGALLCQDWPGPGNGPLAPEQWFGAGDVAAEPAADLGGMVAFLFACYGAGTPELDDFAPTAAGRKRLAPGAFAAALPQALLGRDGGASAVVGHVDRAWGYSFLWPGAQRQTEVYRSTLARLGDGHPVGSALEFVSERYAELATDLSLELDGIRLGRRADDAALAGLWTACSDARNFVVLGDPAVRLRHSTVPASGPSAAPAPRELAVTAPGPSVVPAAGAARAVARPAVGVEVATYVTDDPAGVGWDAATGAITGAQLRLYSRLDLDGNGHHVVTREIPAPTGDAQADAAAQTTLTEVHARMLEVSLAARRASSSGDDGGSS